MLDEQVLDFNGGRGARKICRILKSFRLPKFSTQLFSGICCSYIGKYFTNYNTGSRDIVLQIDRLET